MKVFLHHILHCMLFLIIVLLTSFVVVAQDSEIPFCESDFYYVLIEEQIRVQDPSGNPTVTNVERVLELRSDNAVGLIFPNNVRITVFSTTSKFVAVYPVRASAETNAYRYLDARVPIIATSTGSEQNIFNNQFQEVSTDLPQLNCDSSRLQATRPVEAIGGSYLANLEEQQRTIDPDSTRRTELLNVNFFTHEMIIISSAQIEVAPESLGIAQFTLQQVTPFTFQIAQLGESTIDISMPFLEIATSYTVVSNRDLTIQRFTIIDREIEVDTDGTSTRNDFIAITRQDIHEFFNELRNSAFFVRPSYATRADFAPNEFLRVEFANSTDTEIAEENFVCSGALSLMPGSAPRSFQNNRLANENLSNTVGDGGTIIFNQVDEWGRLSVSINSTNYIIDHWLVECNS